MAVVAVMEEEEVEEVEVEVAGVEAEDRENVDISQAHELSVVLRPQRELGRGRPKSGQVLVSHFVEELWFIHSGWLQQLTARRVNQPRVFV